MGTRLFLETKVQTSRETRPRTPQSDGPQVQISDTGTFGGALFLPSTQDMYRYQVSENVVYVRGKHDVRFGADYNAFNMRNNAFALGLNGAYTFPNLEAFIARQPLALRAELRPQRLHGAGGGAPGELLAARSGRVRAGSIQADVAPHDRAGPPLRHADQSAAAGRHRRRAGARGHAGHRGQPGPAHVRAGPAGHSSRPQQLGAANATSPTSFRATA